MHALPQVPEVVTAEGSEIVTAEGSEIATAEGLKRRVWNFVRRVVSGFRSEHTIGSFLYPQDVEVASLTDPQIGQIFWNMVRCIARRLGAPARTPTVRTLHMLASLQTGLRC